MLAKKDIPNLLTIARIVLIVPFIMALFLPLNDHGRGSYNLAFIIFIVATITDFFDGYLARKWKVESRLGAMLDPIADKLLVTAALVFLISQNIVPNLAAIVILLREMLVSGLREYLGKYSIEMPVSRMAKLKTTIQLVAIGAYLLFLTLDALELQLYGVLMFNLVTNLLIWTAAILTFATGYAYTAISLGIISNERITAEKIDTKIYKKQEMIGLVFALAIFLPFAFNYVKL